MRRAVQDDGHDAPGHDPAAELSERETALWHAWGRARQRLTRDLDEHMEQAVGLTMVEFAVLNILYSAPGRSSRLVGIADRCGLSPSRISRLADTLIRRGLARRDRDGSDGRGTLLVLTEAGLARRNLANPYQNRLARHFVLDHVPPEHLGLFADVVTAIADHDPACDRCSAPDAGGGRSERRA